MINASIMKLKSFAKQCKRILTIATKPGKKDYIALAKVIAAGVAILGIFGFLMHMLFSLLIFPLA
jgi:protein translocase SEC61 complex gamma subunit